MSVSLARAAIADALGAVNDLRVYSWVPDMVNPPAAVVLWPEGSIEHQAHGDDWEYTINVQLIVARADSRAADAALDVLIAKTGSGSAYAALEAVTDPTGVDDITVTRIGDFGILSVGEIDYLACTMSVVVYG